MRNVNVTTITALPLPVLPSHGSVIFVPLLLCCSISIKVELFSIIDASRGCVVRTNHFGNKWNAIGICDMTGLLIFSLRLTID